MDATKSNVVSSVISGIFCLMLFATLRFYADWFNFNQFNTIVGGFVGSWMFIFSLTSVSNIEMAVFGKDFQAKFLPEILFCLTLAVVASGVVHRVCATTCILFSIIGLYMINRISNKYYSKGPMIVEAIATRKPGGKKNK